VNEFVDQCRQEWRRLGVPDPIANEMAADLTADLDEAEAEGASPEDVLGNSAFDPRRFAAAWATARGVAGNSIPERRSPWRSPWAIAIGVLGVLVVVVVGALLLVVVLRGGSVAVVAHRFVMGPGPIGALPPRPGRIVFAGPLGPAFGPTQVVGAGVRLLAVLLFLVGVAGVVGLGVLTVLHRSTRFGSRRFPRLGG
jgi:hypothetical protein